MPEFCGKNIGCDTRTWIVSRTSIEQVSRRWTWNPIGQGHRWMDLEECNGTCSSKHTSIRRLAVPESYQDKVGKKLGC